jgi:hypothetical protein
MNFSFKVTEFTLAQKVEAVARESALGHFNQAHEMFKEALEEHKDHFAIYAEYLRLLYDEGDFKALSEAQLPKAALARQRWTLLEISLVWVLIFCGTLNACDDYHKLESLLLSKHSPDLSRGLDQALGLREMLGSYDWRLYSEQQVCATV